MLKVISTLKQNCIKAAFCSVALLSSSASFGQSWTTLGSTTGVSTGAVSDISMVAVGKAGNDTLYVSYKDAGASNGLVIQMYTAAGGWTTLGSSPANPVRSTSTLLSAGTPYVASAWGTHSYKSNIVYFDGTTWQPMSGGTDCSAGPTDNITLDYAGGIHYYMSFSDVDSNSKALVKQYDGTQFVPMGYASSGAASYISLSHYNSTTPVCISADAGNSGLPTAKYWNGSSFLDISSALSSSPASYTQIASNGTVTYAVFSDNGNGKQAVCQKFSGSPASAAWSAVGSISGFTTNEADYISLALEGVGSTAQPVIAYKDATTGKANVMHYSSGSWSNLGAANFSPGAADFTTLALNRGGDYFVAFADEAHSSKLVVMKLLNPNAVPTVPTTSNKLDIYPNPSNGSFTVKGEKGIYNIVNVIGQTIQTIQLNATGSSVTVNNLNNGVYFIKGANGINQKIVVAK